MKFTSILFTLYLLAILSLVGCSKSITPPPPSVEVTRIEREIIHDTILTTKVDSTLYSALIECKNGKPVLTLPKAVINPTEKVKPISRITSKIQEPKPPDVQLKGNVLEITCYTKAQELFFSWKEKYLEENKTITQTEYIPYPLRWYQKAFMWLGGIFLLISLGGIALQFLKPKIL